MAENARVAAESALTLLKVCAWDVSMEFFNMAHEQCLGCGGVATLEANVVAFAQYNVVVSTGLTV